MVRMRQGTRRRKTAMINDSNEEGEDQKGEEDALCRHSLMRCAGDWGSSGIKSTMIG